MYTWASRALRSGELPLLLLRMTLIILPLRRARCAAHASWPSITFANKGPSLSALPAFVFAPVSHFAFSHQAGIKMVRSVFHVVRGISYWSSSVFARCSSFHLSMALLSCEFRYTVAKTYNTKVARLTTLIRGVSRFKQRRSGLRVAASSYVCTAAKFGLFISDVMGPLKSAPWSSGTLNVICLFVYVYASFFFFFLLSSLVKAAPPPFPPVKFYVLYVYIIYAPGA